MTVGELKIILNEVPEDFEVAMVDTAFGGAARIVDADPHGTVEKDGTTVPALVLA